MSIWPNWRSRSPMRQHLLDDDLVDVPSAEVIERVRVAGKRLHALKPEHPPVRLPDGDLKDPARGKGRQVLALGLDRESGLEHRERAGLDNRIQDPDDRFRVVEACLACEQ